MVFVTAAVVLGLVAAVAVLRRRLVVITVLGSSMAPTYREGDRVLVYRRPARAIRRGQVVVAERPTSTGEWPTPPLNGDLAGRRWVIKRAVALPGDPFPGDYPRAVARHRGTTVPAGMLFLLGDGGPLSFDSKHVGCFPAARVLGVVVRQFGRGRPGRPCSAGARPPQWYSGG